MSEVPYVIEDTISDVCYLTLNRPEKSNALNSEFILSLTHHLNQIKSSNVKVLVLQANGKNFSAGADLKWMKESISLSYEENLEDIQKLSTLLNTLFNLPIPTICSVQGRSFGGALGLISASDIVLAETNSSFCFSEVKLGLIPGVISPYVNFAVGSKNMRNLFLTAEEFSAEKAKEIGLIQKIADKDNIESHIEDLIKKLKENDSYAMGKAKELSLNIYNNSLSEEQINYTIKEIAEIRTKEATQNRLKQFLKSK